MSAEPPPPPLVSPDGRFYWDGEKWVPMPAASVPQPQPVPQQLRQLSPDGMYYWDGHRWVRTAGPTQPPTTHPSDLLAGAPNSEPAGAIHGSLRSGLATSGGIIGIGAALAVLVSSIVPFEHCVPNATAGCWTQWPSLFAGGYPGAWASAANAALQVVLALGVSILITAWMNRTARALSSGALLGIGVLNLVGFFALAVGISADGMQVAAGTVIGLIGSTALTLGGALSALSLRARQDTYPAISNRS